MSELALKVDGKIYAGWKEIKIQRGMRRFADTFELSLTEKWADQEQRRPIKEDSPCSIEIDNELVITGYVDDVNVAYDATSHEVDVVGRSKLGDLVDCSSGKEDFKNSDLKKIATAIGKKFDINVVVNCDVGEAFKNASREVGETHHEFLARLASYRAVHLTSNAEGDLVITRTSKERINTALVLGENILNGSGTRSKRDRFYSYTVTGQQSGNDFSFGKPAAHVKGKATDSNIRKARTTVIIPDDVTLTDVKRIAEYERNIRFGESQAKTYTVNGWQHNDGLWEPNKMVSVKDAYQELDKPNTPDFLIVHVTFIMDEDGQRTELELMPPEALDLIPLPKEKSNEAIF